MKLHLLILISLLSINQAVFALACKQSEIIPLASAHEQTATLSGQFIRIQHIEVLPQNIIPNKAGFTVESVQILMCGELMPQTPAAINTPGQACQFDSNCLQPMRCQQSVCVMP